MKSVYVTIQTQTEHSGWIEYEKKFEKAYCSYCGESCIIETIKKDLDSLSLFEEKN